MNALIKEHQVTDYDNLLDIDVAAESKYSVGDTECLTEISSLLIENDLQQAVGVSLVHKHFPVKEGELMIQDYLNSSNKIEVKPIKREVLGNKDLIPINIRFKNNLLITDCIDS